MPTEGAAPVFPLFTEHDGKGEDKCFNLLAAVPGEYEILANNSCKQAKQTNYSQLCVCDKAVMDDDAPILFLSALHANTSSVCVLDTAPRRWKQSADCWPRLA